MIPKNLIKSSLSCQITSDFVLLENRGNVKFQIEPGISTINLTCKRNSGNGKIVIKNGEEKEYIIFSKNSQQVTLNSEDDILEIRRPKDAQGEVAIIDFSLVKGKNVVRNWKNLINQCGGFNLLKTVGNKLYASEGGWINNENLITKITTEPANLFKREGGKLHFIGNCEVIDLEVIPSVTPNSLSPFKHMSSPPQTLPPASPVPNKNLSTWRTAPVSVVGSKISTTTPPETILYDSMALRAFSKNLRPGGTKQEGKLRYINSNGLDYLLLKSSASFKVPVYALRTATSYSIIISGRKLNGNGKLWVGFQSDNNLAGLNVTIDGPQEDRVFTVYSGDFQGHRQVLISMPPDAVGEILVSRIRVLSAIQVDNNWVSPDVKLQAPTPTNFPYSVDYPVSDPITLSLKRFVNINNNIEHNEIYPELSGTIAPFTLSGLFWFNKVRNMFPNFKLREGTQLDENSLSICDLDNIAPSKKIWLDAFDTQKFSDDHAYKLSQAKIILNPSLSNTQLLQKKTNALVIQAFKPLPYPRPKSIKYFEHTEEDFCLIFNRHPDITQRILESWEPGMPKIILIGGRGKFPDFVIPMNEYLSYHELLYLMGRVKLLMDCPINLDYWSGLTDMMFHLGKPVISSNWHVLDKDLGVFMLSNNRDKNLKTPSLQELKIGWRKGLDMKSGPNITQEINGKVRGMMALVMSAN